MPVLTHLETAAGIPVLSKLEAKNHQFQAIIRVKQHNVSGAINKWLTAPVLSRIVPTWKNLLSVLCLIHLDDVAQQIETYLSKHPLSTLESEVDQSKALSCTKSHHYCYVFAKGGEIAALRKENVILQQEWSDRDETISDLKQQIEASEATIKMLKEKVHSMLSTSPGVVKEQPTTEVEQPSLQRSA